MGGCIRDTVEVGRGLGSRAGRVRCFGLEFVRNTSYNLSRSRPVSSTNRDTGVKRNCTRDIL